MVDISLYFFPRYREVGLVEYPTFSFLVTAVARGISDRAGWVEITALAPESTRSAKGAQSVIPGPQPQPHLGVC